MYNSMPALSLGLKMRMFSSGIPGYDLSENLEKVASLIKGYRDNKEKNEENEKQKSYIEACLRLINRANSIIKLLPNFVIVEITKSVSSPYTKDAVDFANLDR